MDFVIAALPRTGSTMLCGLLTNNRAGRPVEHLNPDADASPFALAASQHVSTERYLALARLADTVDGVFGTKLMVHWLPTIHACCSERHEDYTATLRHLFPDARYIFLRRRNLAALAASYTVALASGSWRGSQTDDDPNVALLLEEMHRNLLWLRRCEADWIDILAKLKVEPLNVYYEDLIASTTDSLLALFSYIGVSRESLMLDSGSVPQRTAATLALQDRYVSWLREKHAQWYINNQIPLSLL